MFKAQGQLKYYPSWWLLLEADDGVCEYYRHLVFKYSPSIQLNKPKKKAHVTVISGRYEKPLHEEFWGKHVNQPIEFSYGIDIETDGIYFWLPVECQKIEEVRVELGLPSKIPIPWHLSIGHLKN